MDTTFAGFLDAIEHLQALLDDPEPDEAACLAQARQCGREGARAQLPFAEVQRILGLAIYPPRGASADLTEEAILLAASGGFVAG